MSSTKVVNWFCLTSKAHTNDKGVLAHLLTPLLLPDLVYNMI